MNVFLDPYLLAKLGSLELQARTVVEGFITGLHKSPAYGHSLEFSEHRPYSFGDELKHLDWKIYAKTDRFTVKRYEQETSLRAMIFVDASHSMSFGTTGQSKWEYVQILAACLSYLLLRQQDAAGLEILGPGIKIPVPIHSGRGHLMGLLESLVQAVPQKGEFSFGEALKDSGDALKRRGLVIVLSDLLEDQDAIIKSLRYLRYKKHEVIVFQILDPSEITPPWKGPVRFEDLETGSLLMTEPEIVLKEYQRLMGEFLDRYRAVFRNAGIDYSFFSTKEPLEKALGLYLSRRARIYL